MQVERAAIADVLILTPRRHGDARGFFCETWSRRDFAAAVGRDVDFVQDNQALSAARHTIRGLHFQTPPQAQAKLVRVGRGAILDVAVDLRRGSASYGRHVALRLDAALGRQAWIPAGFAHGYCTLEDDTEVLYKTDAPYAPDCDRGLAFDDPALAIRWPVAPDAAVVSARDRSAPRLADLASPFP